MINAIYQLLIILNSYIQKQFKQKLLLNIKGTLIEEKNNETKTILFL